MQAYYYWDPTVQGKDQLFFTFPQGQAPNRGFRASDASYLREVDPKHLFPFFRVLPETRFQCRPIFIRTERGVSIIVIVEGQVIPLAESAPGATQGIIQTGFDLAVPLLAEDQSNRSSIQQTQVQSCDISLERKARVLAALKKTIGQVNEAGVVRISKIKAPFVSFDQIDTLLKQGKILTYSLIEAGDNSIFLFVNDEGEVFLTLLYWDRTTNTVHPPKD